MNVDLWSPGHYEDSDGNKGYLLNAMCNIVHFMVSSLTSDIIAASLAQLFMADILLKLSMCSVLVIYMLVRLMNI